MPRYYFHLYDDIISKDHEGQLLPNIQAARVYAIEAARAMMAAEIQEKGTVSLSDWLEVEDEQGEVVLIVKFDEAVNIKI